MRLMAARVRVADPATGFLVGRWLCVPPCWRVRSRTVREVPYQQTNLPGQ